MKIKDCWRHMNEINRNISYFPPDTTIGTVHVIQTIFMDNEHKDIVDGILPQAFKGIFRKNQYNVSKHPISDALNYLQSDENSYGNGNITHTLSSSASGGNFKKCKGNTKGKGSKT